MKQKINYSLEELALKQLQFSEQYCESSCKSYHASWAILRAHGLVGGIDSDKENYCDIINSLFDSKEKVRILIAGCADSGILNMVLSSNLENYTIDIVDRCQTPLLSSKKGLNFDENVFIYQSDLLEFQPTHSYDLIVCHSLLPFFDDFGRKKLLSLFSNWLDFKGKVIVSLREKLEHQDKISVEEKTIKGYEQLKSNLSIEDLKNYYTIIENQNLPYYSFDEGVKEFTNANLKVISTFYGGIGKSFSSTYGKPRSFIFLASKGKR